MTELVGCAFKGILVPLLGTGRNQLKLGTLLVLTKASLKTPLLPEQPNLKKHICLNHHTSPLPRLFSWKQQPDSSPLLPSRHSDLKDTQSFHFILLCILLPPDLEAEHDVCPAVQL